MKRVVVLAAAVAALTCAAASRAHHSIGMIDTSTPVWVKGAVVRYEIVNPHTMVEVEERRADGQTTRWTVEGPSLRRIRQFGVDENFLELGDVIEVCGFRPKYVLQQAAVAGGAPLPIVHGHLLVLPDGRWSQWGSYGKMENCVRAGDQAQSWLDFLNGNEIARLFWCNPYRKTVPTIAESSALVDDINRRMASPCE